MCSPSRYIVINEARSGSSWLQEISMMHPGIKVQFELDMEHGPSALACKQCHRPETPDSKSPERIPPKIHPPQACGMTIIGTNNKVDEVRALASRHNASLVILLRKNHVAHAISSYRRFARAPPSPGAPRPDPTVPWSWSELDRHAGDKRAAYHRLLSFAAAGRPTHLVFYEDLEARPAAVWRALQAFLGVPQHDPPGIATLEPRSTARPPGFSRSWSVLK